MPKKDYGKLEQHIISVFKNESSFTFKGEQYKLITATKPSVQSGGECKTDVYIYGETASGNTLDIKLSVKKESSNEFQENKVSAKRAESYFGENWSNIITDTCLSIKDRFEEQPLVFGTGKHPTKPNSITLGWKLEISSKPRKLSAKINLSESKIRDYVYKGTNLSQSKRDALINGVVVPNSGIANYILYSETDAIKSTADIINNMQLIDEIELKPTYLIFTGNNLRTDVDKTDGARPLAVRVNWKVVNGKLDRDIIFDEPLFHTGKEWKNNVKQVFSQIGLLHPINMTYNNFNNHDLFIP